MGHEKAAASWGVLGEVETLLALERDDAADARAVAEECAAICRHGPFQQLAHAVVPSLVEAHLALGNVPGSLDAIEWLARQPDSLRAGNGSDRRRTRRPESGNRLER